MNNSSNNLNFNLVSEWYGGFKGELFFTPSKKTDGWEITFDADFEIRGIWGAKVVSREGNRITLEPVHYNQQLSAGETQKITIVANSDSEDANRVDNLDFYYEGEQPQGSDFNANYNVVESWNGGFKSELFFTPEEDSANWRIELSADFEVGAIWGAKVVSHNGDRLILESVDYNRQLYSGQTQKITIIGTPNSGGDSGIENFTFYELGSNVNSGENSSNTGKGVDSSDPGGNSSDEASDGNNTEMSYEIVENWNGGFKSELFFTPEEDSANWRIELNADFEVGAIWGANVVSHEGDRLILEPVDHNRNVFSGQTHKITIIGELDPGESPNASNLAFSSDYQSNDNDNDVSNDLETPPVVTTNSNNVRIDHEVVEDWNGGFKSELSLLPEGNSVSDWRIELDADFDIRGIYGAQVASHNGDRFILEPASYNRQLNSGETQKIVIVADTDPGESSNVRNLNFYSGSGNTVTTIAPEVPDAPMEPPTPEVTTVVIEESGKRVTTVGTGQFNYGEVAQKSLLFYEAQRSGNLPDDNRIQWRGDSNLGDGSDVGVDLTGGYFDAGDHVKFGMPMAASMAILSWGGVEYEDAYKGMGQWDELLDTVKWGTDWILKAHINPNGQTQEVYVQVGDGHIDHSVWTSAENLATPRPSFKIDSNNPGSDISADYAATLASASMLFQGENQAYANRLIREAKQLYEFAENNLGRYSDSVPQVQPFYRSWSGYGDELIWGAAWLYKATGEQQYLNKAKQYANQYGIQPGTSTLSWDDKKAGALVILAQTGDQTYIDLARQWLDGWLPGGGTAQYTNGGLAWNGQWGSLRTSASTAFVAGVFDHTVEQDSRYHDFTRNQVDYILGDNPRNSSYVVGYGNNSPQNPHHRSASGSAGQYGPGGNEHTLFGALVGGPKSANDFDWQDDRNDFIGNEVALDYNAGFTGALAHLYTQYGGDPLSEEQLDLLVGIDAAGI